ncbi:major facilitator superfamily domain-containing protein [Cryomyces antarcticus]
MIDLKKEFFSPQTSAPALDHDPGRYSSESASSVSCDASQIEVVEARRLNRKLDARVLPPLVFLWFLSFVDRVNIGNARLQGLEKDLQMTGNDFNVTLVVFFVPFILFEVPSNLVSRKLAPSTWLSLEVFLLAIFTIGQGVITTYGGLVTMRFFVGLFEAGLVPGSVFLLASYYPRFDLQWRLNILMVANALASAFGGLLAYAIAGMDGDGPSHYKGWRWIFIIEGSVTAAVAIACKWIIVDWPATASWLTDADRALITRRIARDAGTCRMDKLNVKALRRCLLDWKVWVTTIVYIGTCNSTYSINLFAPTIVQQLNPNFSPRHVQALVIPIFAVSALAALLSALGSDKLRHRYGFAMGGYLISGIGFVVLLAQHHVAVGVRYMALYFVSAGSYVTLPLLWTLLANNVAGQYKVSIAAALQIGLGNSGGIIASLIYTKQQAPFYSTGYDVSFALLLFSALLLTLFVLGLRWENEKRNAGGRDYRITDLPAEEVENLGDDHPDFRFVY